MSHLQAVCILNIVGWVVFTESTIVVRNSQNLPINQLEDKEASFGLIVQSVSPVGHLVAAIPPDGCSHIAPPPITNRSILPWISIIKRTRQGCHFDTKVLNAQKAGYIAAIVYDDWSNELITMQGGENASLVEIPSVFVGNMDGHYLIRNFNMNVHYSIALDADFSNVKLLLPFTVAVGVFALLMVVSLVIKYGREVYRRQKSRLSVRSLKKLPVKKFQQGDVYDTCAICLEDYVINDKLRVLPCSHVFHVPCIDPWLTKNKCTCPICKRHVFPRSQRPTDSDDDSDDSPSESSPLLSAVANNPMNNYSSRDVSVNTLHVDVEQVVSELSDSEEAMAHAATSQPSSPQAGPYVPQQPTRA